MKTIAMAVAVLALGLAGCADSSEVNTMAANDMMAANEAAADLNMAMNEISAEDVDENALDNAPAAIENAQEAVDNAAGNTTAGE